MKTLFKTKDRVEYFLKTYPKLRDDDNRLISNIWADELIHKGLSYDDCLYAISKGVLSSPESIRRSRQKLQEHNEGYRGLSWNSRQKRGNKIKKEIKNHTT